MLLGVIESLVFLLPFNHFELVGDFLIRDVSLTSGVVVQFFGQIQWT